MANIIDILTQNIKPYKRILLISFLIIIFALVSYYCYITFFLPKKNVFSDVANTNKRQTPAEIYFFYATWCPHCKTAFPEWKQFTEEYDGKIIGNYKIKCTSVNCTSDNGGIDSSGDQKINQLISDFKVDSYPTVKMMKDNIQIDYDAKVSKYNLEQFVHSVAEE